MPLLHLLVIAAVQGITEFLPISSSAHLILVPKLTGWTDQGVLIDIAVHVGTLGAVLLYFHRDVLRLARGFGHTAVGRATPERRLFWLLILATIPVMAAGLAIDRLGLTSDLRSAGLIAGTTIGFGILLYVVDRTCLTVSQCEHVGVRGALFIGLAQVLALIPGTSRSGITMTAARYLGLERTEAARFSMLLSIPTIVAAGALAGIELWQTGDVAIQGDAILAAGLAFISALAALALMMSWLRRASFTPFVIYRLLLGGYLLYWLYTGDALI